MELNESSEINGKLQTFLVKSLRFNKIIIILEDCETTGPGFDDLNHSISWLPTYGYKTCESAANINYLIIAINILIHEWSFNSNLLTNLKL